MVLNFVIHKKNDCKKIYHINKGDLCIWKIGLHSKVKSVRKNSLEDNLTLILKIYQISVISIKSFMTESTSENFIF